MLGHIIKSVHNSFRNSRFFFSAILLVGIVIPQSLQAQPIRVVALGASNTNGKGVSTRSAWPAQLQAMLRKKGYDARVSNAGVNGNTTRQMRARLNSAAAPGTQIVILSIPLTNDRRRNVNTRANVASMISKLKKRAIKTIVIDRPHLWAKHQLQRDGIHFTVAGHRTVAARLLPLVVSKIGR